MTCDQPRPGPGARPAADTAVLGQNQYGKAETRVVRITRDGPVHHIRDLNVSVALTGDLEEVHYSGSNAHVLPTDTVKNTVYAFAGRHGIASAEEFGIALARHFVDGTAPLRTARIRIEEYAWQRIAPGGVGEPAAGHSFVREGRETRTAQVAYDGERLQVLSGLTDMTVLNSTDSEFHGFLRDEYTTLPEDRDRILATDVTAVWRHAWTGGGRVAPPDWEESHAQARAALLRAFAGTYSYSLQQTLYAMGASVVEARPEIDEIRLSLPNKHHFLVDLSPFGIDNDAAGGGVYHAADRPYGLIEATVLRTGARQLIPEVPTHP